MILAAAGVHVEVGALERLGELVDAPAALVTEPVVSGIHGADAQLAFPFAETHELPSGEAAKQITEVERLWRGLRIGRGATIVALGGGSLTDAAGFAAATYLRGVPWVPVPTTMIGQVDAAIGGKTAVDLPEGKNLVGAFHWPARTVIDPALLETLTADERLNGMAEVVKTGLLAGESLGAVGRGARPPLRRVQVRRLPPRPARRGAASRAQPRPHVRARARVRGGLRPAARACGGARPARRAAPFRPADKAVEESFARNGFASIAAARGKR